MIRFAIALSMLALSAGAAAAQSDLVNPPAIEAQQVYKALQVQEVEQQMLYDDNLLTYGYAVVSCGLRTPQWLELLRDVYSKDYAAELQQVPLDTAQQAEAFAYSKLHVENPSPPPYICGRLQQDSALADIDYAVALQSFQVGSAK